MNYILDGLFVICLVVWIVFVTKWFVSLFKKDTDKMNFNAVGLCVFALLLNVLNLFIQMG